jgi:hypothetical protein
LIAGFVLVPRHEIIGWLGDRAQARAIACSRAPDPTTISLGAIWGEARVRLASRMMPQCRVRNIEPGPQWRLPEVSSEVYNESSNGLRLGACADAMPGVPAPHSCPTHFQLAQSTKNQKPTRSMRQRFDQPPYGHTCPLPPSRALRPPDRTRPQLGITLASLARRAGWPSHLTPPLPKAADPPEHLSSSHDALSATHTQRLTTQFVSFPPLKFFTRFLRA